MKMSGVGVSLSVFSVLEKGGFERMTRDEKILALLRSPDYKLNVVFLYIALELNRNVIQVTDVIRVLVSSPIWGQAVQQKSRFMSRVGQNLPQNLNQLLADLNREVWAECDVEKKGVIQWVEDRIRINEAKAVIGTILYDHNRAPDCSGAFILKSIAETVHWVCLEICYRAIYIKKRRGKGAAESRELSLDRGIRELLRPLMLALDQVLTTTPDPCDKLFAADEIMTLGLALGVQFPRNPTDN